MKNALIALPLLFAAAACSQQKSADDAARTGPYEARSDVAATTRIAPPTAEAAKAAGTAVDIAEQAASLSPDAPDVAVNAAPGVAFDFSYSFTLAADRISGVQEEHAEACQKLGVARCRITGMRYSAQHRGDVGAMTAFKLDPAIARSFAKDATRTVEQAEGKLATAELQGSDVGSRIAADEGQAASLRAELASIERQLAVKGLASQVRIQLDAQARDLRETLRNLERSQDQGKASLATTPVVFNYATASGLPGLGEGSPFAGAATASVNSFVTMLQFFMVAIGVIAPWALFGGAIFWIVRRFRKGPVAPQATTEPA
jgi:Domain of unknown function (DUF4349)